ncbi:hypothetical protein EGW08_007923 [Elysia chlorotica]|uniref:Uncharacterized protein n=1 Tax=Elysia chlorotica TaxID=188477 RepID=A0A433TRT0_ELYCH|nr:hypothetical protein EGW08_007923 [Elysia chlorotica]
MGKDISIGVHYLIHGVIEPSENTVPEGSVHFTRVDDKPCVGMSANGAPPRFALSAEDSINNGPAIWSDGQAEAEPQSSSLINNGRYLALLTLLIPTLHQAKGPLAPTVTVVHKAPAVSELEKRTASATGVTGFCIIVRSAKLCELVRIEARRHAQRNGQESGEGCNLRHGPSRRVVPPRTLRACSANRSLADDSGGENVGLLAAERTNQWRSPIGIRPTTARPIALSSPSLSFTHSSFCSSLFCRNNNAGGERG